LQALFPVDPITGTGIMVPRVMQTIGPILLLTIGFIAFLWKELKIAAFDPALATAMGLNATVVHYLLMAMVSGVTVASFEAVGAILVVAMLIVPAATAQFLSDRLETMLAWSVATAGLAAIAGGILGPVLDTSISGMMAVSAGFFFLLAVLFAPRHGVLSKIIRNARLALRIAGEDILGQLYRVQEAVGSQRPAEEIDRLDAAGRATGHGLIGRLAMLDLKRQGLLQVEDRGPGLTEKGRRRAESIVRAHRLWETYMEKDFALPIDHVHDPAERMEHFLGPDLQSELAAQLGEPAVDPHGRQIPPAG
jgi:Mn-dependent DtxR family transcriptional regulator